MKVLIFGDVVAKPGRKAIVAVLPALKEEFNPDLVIVNAENMSHGIGATPSSIQELQNAGVDFFTSGNHIWKKGEIITLLNQPKPIVLRPANYPPGLPGSGERVLQVGARTVLVVNLMGRVFFKEALDCPFRCLDEILTRYHLRTREPAAHGSEPVDTILVDFHCEASSEKTALGLYADGQVSAFWGTHTHVPTADSRILPKGTAYRSDVGMTGLTYSVIGANPEAVIRQFLTQVGESKMHDVDESGEVTVNGQILDIEGADVKQWELVQRIVNI